ncbi:MAG: glycoside hydrolase family 20 zincin-like fold domain-containing protein [Pirellulales bacterium]
MRYSLSAIGAGMMTIIVPAALPAALPAGEQPLVTPAPRDLTWTDQRLDLVDAVIRAVEPQEQQVARLLAHEMQRLHDVKLTVTSGASSKPGPSITLALAGSPEGGTVLEKMAGKVKWPPPRNAEEGYLLEVGSHEAVLFAESQRGLVYGCQTLLQLVRQGPEGKGKQFLGARIADSPQLGFRGVHICIFPNTELAAVRQMILLAARFKYNAVVIEFWSSLKSKKRPETAYENAYSPEQIRPLVRLGHALGMEMIPMLNSWGHASGMRNRSGEHVVLDRYPQHKGLYEPNGWSFCLSNPEVYDHLFDRYDELLELFAPVRYFHLGLDEAWGHLGLKENRECRGDEPLELIGQHLHKLHEYFAGRKIKVLMWHDMFLQRDHPQLGRLSPANSVPPFNTHLALPKLPRDVIIATWNYSQSSEWPVPEYFHDKGFPVVVCPWKKKQNTIMLVNVAKKHDLLGVLATTWDSLDVSQPSVGRAGVLAWTAPGYDLKEMPFDHWLGAIRALPICDLPKLERTLEPSGKRR